MDVDLIIRIGYAVMMLAVALSFLFSKRQLRELRLAVNRFAFAFVRLSNLAAPVSSQRPTPETLTERALSEKSVKLYTELANALSEVERRCGHSRRLNRQFAEPIRELFSSARAFLVGCEHPESLSDPEAAALYERFLTCQTDFRRTLLRRISGDAGAEFASLNRGYDLQEPEKNL